VTLSEFKAWFEGFSEGIEAAPTADQFAKIKAKVALIDGAPITYPIYVERVKEVYPKWPNYPLFPYWASQSGGTTISYATQTTNLSFLDAVGRTDGIGKATAAGYAYIDPATKGDTQTEVFDSHAAKRELGRAEAMN